MREAETSWMMSRREQGAAHQHPGMLALWRLALARLPGVLAAT